MLFTVAKKEKKKASVWTDLREGGLQGGYWARTKVPKEMAHVGLNVTKLKNPGPRLYRQVIKVLRGLRLIQKGPEGLFTKEQVVG